MNPVLLVIAGPNGAGKTTLTVKLRAEKWSDDVEYLNPDDIARDRFGDWNSPKASLDAARWTTERREWLLAARAGIADSSGPAMQVRCFPAAACRSRRGGA